MKIAKNTVFAVFIAYNALIYFILFPIEIACVALGYQDLCENLLFSIEGYCPLFFHTRWLALLGVSEGKFIVTALFTLIGLLPLIGCIFIKKPWIYRIASYTFSIPICFSECIGFSYAPLVISNIVYMLCIVAIDVLNTKCIERDKRKAINASQETVEISEI